jgi:hypothetical protein
MDRQTICRAVALVLAVSTPIAAEAQLSGPGAMTPNSGPFGAPIGTPPAKKVDPQLEAAEKAFLALDIAERKAIQLDLIWAAKFPGSPTGDFGPLTFSAIKRFQAEIRFAQNAILTAGERARLGQIANERRKAANFGVHTDAVSGMKIGLPGFLAAKTSPNASGGSRWQDAAERVTVDMLTYKPDDALPDLFERGIDPKVRGRKITYKLLRPEFFVITGETAGGKFYRRAEIENGVIRGFSIGYDKALAATVDPYIVAIAATFEPFPKAGGVTPPKASPLVATAPTKRRTTGLALTPTLIATGEEALKGCRDIAVATGPDTFLPAKLSTKLGDTGLVMLEAKSPAPLALRFADPADGAATLVQRDAEGALLASAATITGGKVATSLQEGGAGAALFDRSGAFVGVIAASPVMKFRVAGIVPTLSYPLVPAKRLMEGTGLAPATGGDTAPKSAAAIAEANRAGIVSLICRSDP